MKILILIFFPLNFIFSQNPNQLIEKKNNLLEEIKLSKKTLESAKKQKNISIQELQALSTYIELRKDLKNTIVQQKDSIELYKTEIEQKIYRTNQKKQLVLASYKNLIRSIYFNDFQISMIDFIFSTQSFKQSINRYIYYKDQEHLRKNLLHELDFLRDQLFTFKLNLNKSISLKDTLIIEFNNENDSLNFLKDDKERLSRQLAKRESDLIDYINQKKKEAKKIEDEIVEIQKQVELRNANLSDGLGFEKNKNKLIWPVEKGVLLSNFGEVFHKDLPGIKIVNNGIEIGVEEKAYARSVYDGTISKILIMSNGLKAIIIRHGQYLTVYSNLTEINVQVGESIFTGNRIGTIFSRPHDDSGILEFQIWKGLEKINPMNWLKE